MVEDDDAIFMALGTKRQVIYSAIKVHDAKVNLDFSLLLSLPTYTPIYTTPIKVIEIQMHPHNAGVSGYLSPRLAAPCA